MASSGNRDDSMSFINSFSSPVAVASESDGYLAGDQIGSASGSFQNEGILSAGAGADSGSNSDAEYGFLRPDFGIEMLVGTVHVYARHVFLCYKSPHVWPPRVEAAEFDRLPRLLSAAVMARKGDMKRKTRLTICEGHDGTETSNGDILIFPDMVRYRRLTHFDVDTFVEEVLVKDTEWLPGTPEPLRGWYVFVCSHGSRDRKCGVCGPVLVTKFKEEIDSRSLQGQVTVSPCSHIGGHKYAGNVIIFGPHNGEVTGHWYGYVAPDDVSILLEHHIVKGEIVDHLWRGQMGLSEEEQRKSQELRLQLMGEPRVAQNSSIKPIHSAEIVDDAVKQAVINTNGCCQSNGGFCCQTPTPVVHSEKSERNHVISREGEGEGEGEGMIRGNRSKESKISGKGAVNTTAATRKVCAMPTWYESWEREDTYAVLAVAGALVSVAVAYNCYRQLR